MTTQEVIANIGAKATDYSPVVILNFLNMFLAHVYSKDLTQTTYKDSQGMPPFLITKAGKREYPFPPSTYTKTVGSEQIPVVVRRTKLIFTEWDGFITSYNRTRLIWNPIKYNRRKYYDVPIKSDDRSAADDAKVYFDFDPGDTTERYFHLFQISTPKLESINQQIFLPEGNDMYLIFAVLWIIKNEDYGDEKALAVIDDIAKKIWRNIRGSAQGEDTMTEVRPESTMLYEDDPNYYRRNTRNS